MLTAPHCLSRLAARQQRACCMSQAAVLLQPTTQQSSRRCVQVAAAKDGSSWYHQSSGSKGHSSSGGGSSGSTGPSSSSSQRQRSRHYYDSTPRHKSRQPNSDNKSRTSQHQSPHREDDYEDDLPDVEGLVPHEVNAAEQLADAVAARFASGSGSIVGIAGMNLSKWQEEKLLLAAAGSKKKMQVQALAADLGLDRTEVLAWVQAFRTKPKQEQAKLLAPLQQQIQQQQQRQQQQQQRQQRQHKEPPAAAIQPAPSSSSGAPEAAAAQPAAALPFSAPNPNTGYVPFAARRAGAAPKGKRLPAEVLRTLEGVYDRSPWPSKEVVAGLYDLHRLHRDVVLDWFTARRDMDGLPHNPRQAKLARTAQQAAAAATEAAQPQQLQQQQQQQANSPQQQQQQQRGSGQPAAAAAALPAVSRLTAKELASLRSALPSPKKFKGQKLAEELGIKTVKGAKGSTPQVEIAGVTFVARDGAAAWRGAWRRRRAARGLPAQRLDFQKWFV